MASERELQMEAQAKRAVLALTAWFSLGELATLAEIRVGDLEAQVLTWKQADKLFSVIHDEVELFPAYGFEGNKLRPNEDLAAILNVLSPTKDSWGIAYWFASANGFLGGSRPQDKLWNEPERVLLAAEDEVAGITHG